MTREEKALHYFRNGFNCAQSVLASFQDVISMPEEVLLGISRGFGAGMGRQQNTCGAVSGAYMVLGTQFGKTKSDDAEAGEKTYRLTREFAAEFNSIHKTVMCDKLLDCDLMTEEGKEKFQARDMKKNICERCVADAVRITEKMISQS